MTRVLIAAVLLCVGAAAAACPLCLGAFQQTKGQQLIAAPQAVLAVPTAEADRYRVVDVIKGERPSSATIEGGHSHFGSTDDEAAAKSGKPILLIRDDGPLPAWVILGAVGANHAAWLRKLAAGKPSANTSPQEWSARTASAVPYLEHREPLLAELAYDELAAAPYPALLSLKASLAPTAVRHWLADPALVARERLYLLLLGVVGGGQDAVAIERRLDIAWSSGDPKNVGPLLAADLQLRGPARLAWVDDHYLRNRERSTHEVEAALLALSVQGSANSAIPRERVIQSYRMFIRERKDIAGYVAPDLAAWQYWDAVPDYVALMKSDARQQYPSRLAIVAYLRQSPGGGKGLGLPEIGDTEKAAGTSRVPLPALPM